MFLSGTWLIIISDYELPFLEFYVEVLASFADDVDEADIIVKSTILVLAPKGKDTLIPDLITKATLKFVSVY